MPRKPRKERLRENQDLPGYLYKYLTLGEPPNNEGLKKWQSAEGAWEIRGLNLTKAWETHKKKIMDVWITEQPGSRPWSWWIFDAPEMRKRLGGIGSPYHEHLGGGKGSYNFGCQDRFITKFDEEYYNGRARRVDGALIPDYATGKPLKYKDGDFKGIGYDKNDPPRFETELDYLIRLNLLSKSEKKALKL